MRTAMPPRPIRITRPYYLGKYEVTQLQWRSIMGSNPSEVERDELAVDQYPVRGCTRFCRKLSAALAVNVTLPTEAQWENACRAGTSTRFYTGDSDADLARAAWFYDNSGNQPHPVGQKEPTHGGSMTCSAMFTSHPSTTSPHTRTCQRMIRKETASRTWGRCAAACHGSRQPLPRGVSYPKLESIWGHGGSPCHQHLSRDRFSILYPRAFRG